MTAFGIITLFLLGVMTGILISIIVVYNVYGGEEDE